MAAPKKLPPGITLTDGGKYRARYRDPDKREHTRHFTRLVDATSWLNAAKVDMERGTYVSPTAGKEDFERYAERWRQNQVDWRPSTAAIYERQLRLQVYPVLGRRPIGLVRRGEIHRRSSRTSLSEGVLQPSSTSTPC